MTLGTPVALSVKHAARAFAPGMVALALALAPAAARAEADDPPCSINLTLPQSALELHLDYRQLGPDLTRFQEAEGIDAVGLHQLQVMSLLAEGARLTSGVTLRVGGHVFKPASYQLGFTVGLGGAMRFFAVDGTEAVPLPSTDVTPGWSTERLVMNLEYVGRASVHLVWHLGVKAGRIDLGLGGSAEPEPAAAPAPPAPSPAAPKPGAPKSPSAPGSAGLPVKPATPPVTPGTPAGSGGSSGSGGSPTPIEPPSIPPKPVAAGPAMSAPNGAPRGG